jgi:hypothetical protein
MKLVLPCLHLCTATVGAVYCAHYFNGSSEQQYPEASLPSYAVGAALRAAMTLAHFLRRVVFPDDLRAHYQFPRHSELQAIYHLVDDASSSSSDGVGAFADVTVDPSAVMALAFILAVTAFFVGLAFDPHTVVASYVFCYTIVLPSFLVHDGLFVSLFIYCCMSAFSDTT